MAMLTFLLVEHVPVDDYTLPLSSAEVLQPGADITLLSWGAPLYSCLEAMQLLRDPPASIAHNVPSGIRDASIELIDLRTILPWDRQSEFVRWRALTFLTLSIQLSLRV